MGSTSIIDPIPTTDNGRQPWSSYFISLAEVIATRSTCDRLHVGAVFVRDSRILCTGYNGSLPGRPHCQDVGCVVVNGSCQATVHAETNAIAQAAQHGVSLKDSWLYVTHIPCLACFKIVLAAGCSRIYYSQFYGATSLEMYRSLQGMARLEQIK